MRRCRRCPPSTVRGATTLGLIVGNVHDLGAVEMGGLRATDPGLLCPKLASHSGIVIDVVTPAIAAFLARYLPDADPATETFRRAYRTAASRLEVAQAGVQS